MTDKTNDERLLTLSPVEQEAVAALQQELGLETPSEVMQTLLRQAAQRALVVCPSCGHSARKTASDEASCAECMSVLHLTDGIWQIISLE
jgi:protein-arginine kinase activator protein McsA